MCCPGWLDIKFDLKFLTITKQSIFWLVVNDWNFLGIEKSEMIAFRAQTNDGE